MSSINSIQSANGMFIITDETGKQQTVDLGVLMMMINLKRVANLDNQIALQVQEIQERNTTIQELTEFMSECRRLKAEGLGDGTNSGTLRLLTINGETRSLWVDTDFNKPWAEGLGVDNHESWATKLGIEWTQHKSHNGGTKPKSDKDLKVWENTWDTNINNIKSKIEILNNDSQLANIKLQNLLEKRNNAFEMTTKVMDTNNQSIQSVLRNL